MKNFLVFVKMMTIKGHWKHSGKTNKIISNSQRMWMAVGNIIGAIVTLATLGRVTCWADVGMGLEYAVDKRNILDGQKTGQ